MLAPAISFVAWQLQFSFSASFCKVKNTLPPALWTPRFQPPPGRGVRSWPHDTDGQKAGLRPMREMIPKHSRVWSLTADRWQGLRALSWLSATYFIHREGYHDTKYYKKPLVVLVQKKQTFFCRNLAFLNNNRYRVKTATAWKDGRGPWTVYFCL